MQIYVRGEAFESACDTLAATVINRRIKDYVECNRSYATISMYSSDFVLPCHGERGFVHLSVSYALAIGTDFKRDITRARVARANTPRAQVCSERITSNKSAVKSVF